ncbi:MAG: sugar ABC transporter ATP-binding protein [Arenicella sp.]
MSVTEQHRHTSGDVSNPNINVDVSELHSSRVQPLIELKGITKRYPGVTALKDVQLTVMPGEVHILFGENGAGKSTLISTIAGVQQPSEGQIIYKGEPRELSSVHEARDLGISAVFQEFSLVPQLTIAQNLFLGAEQCRYGFLDKKGKNKKAQDILDRLGFDLNPNHKVAYLSRAEQQMVEIAKAFRSELSILILDEPTASLTEKETNRLFELVEQLKEKGVGIIYITHRMSEIKKIGDRITILRDGKYIDCVDAARATEDELVTLMTGRVIDSIFPQVNYKPADTALDVNGLSTQNGRIQDVSITIREGEIVGFAGLVGSGKSELLRACFGLSDVRSGSVKFHGEEVTGFSPKQMLDRGFFYNPPDRRAEGLAMIRSCRENMTFPSLGLKKLSRGLFLRRAKEKQLSKDLAEKLQLHPMNVERQVGHFSGGNQQKVLLAKCLTRDVKLYVFDEPTVGVDVGTRSEIYKFIADICESGAAVVLISSDLPEVLNLSNRAYVMYRGQLQAELSRDEITEQNLLKHFFERNEV